MNDLINQLKKKIDAVDLGIKNYLSSTDSSNYTNHEQHELNDLYQKREKLIRMLEQAERSLSSQNQIHDC